jgi:membrane protein
MKTLNPNWLEKPRSFWRELIDHATLDRVGSEAARAAFYLFLSLFPFILALFAVTSWFGGEVVFGWIMGQLTAALPGQASTAVEDFVREVTRSPSAGLVSVGLLLTIWSASNAFAALSDGLNAAYRVQRQHRWWKKRALAFGLLVVMSGAAIGSALIVLAGPEIASTLGVPSLESFLRWPLTYLLAVALSWLIYLWLPNHDQSREKRRILVGAVVGTSLWVLGTVAFRAYVANFDRFHIVYGFLGGVVMLQLWCYLTALSILVGGEVAAILERHRAAERLSLKGP